MEDRKEMNHKLVLENREKMFISGIEEVESFDENEIAAYTVDGLLVIRGTELHIGKLNTDDGELSVEGNIDSLTYSDSGLNRGGFFSKLIK
jgi:sporulation protein YabP